MYVSDFLDVPLGDCVLFVACVYLSVCVCMCVSVSLCRELKYEISFKTENVQG